MYMELTRAAKKWKESESKSRKILAQEMKEGVAVQ